MWTVNDLKICKEATCMASSQPKYWTIRAANFSKSCLKKHTCNKLVNIRTVK